jgi:UPF0716 protein FxsA
VDGARFFARFLDADFVVRLLLTLLLVSLLPLAEIVVILFVGDLIGRYLTLAIVASIGLLGALAAARRLRGLLEAARARIRAGDYPAAELADVAGVLVAGLLLVAPGLITDAMGLLVFVPAVRRAVGRLITRRMQRRLTEVYEYLRLYDL